MIPALFIAGLLIGLFPRRVSIAGVVLAAAAWTYVHHGDGLPHNLTDAAITFAWGVGSLAIGTLIAQTAKRLISADVQSRRN